MHIYKIHNYTINTLMKRFSLPIAIISTRDPTETWKRKSFARTFINPTRVDICAISIVIG